MNTNEHPIKELTLLVEGELSEDESRRVEGHLKHCLPCQEIYEKLKSALDLLSRLPQPEATFTDLVARRARENECDRLAEALTCYAYEGRDPDVELHIQRCLRCGETLHSMRVLMGLLDAIGTSQATFSDLRGRLRPAVRWHRVLASAAALFIVFAGALWIRLRSEPPPIVVPSVSRSAPTNPEHARVLEILSSLETLDEMALQAAASKFDRDSALTHLALAEAMQNPRDTLRSYSAIRILRYLETPAAEDLLARALGKNTAQDQFLLRALVELKSEAAVPLLVRQLEDPSRRQRALEDLAQLRDPETMGAMAEFLDDSSQRPRIGELLAGFSLHDLIEVCDQHRNAPHFVAVPRVELHTHLIERAKKEASFWTAASRSASESGVSGVLFLLQASQDRSLVEETLVALKQCPPTFLEQGLTHSLYQKDLNPSALRLIAELKLERLIPELERETMSGRLCPEDTLPVLAQLDGKDAVAFIMHLLLSERMAKAAAQSLRGIKGSLLAKTALSLLREPRYVQPLVDALSDIQEKELGAFFVRALRYPDVRHQAIEAVARLRYERAVPALIPYLTSDTTALQAQEALKQITGKDFGRDRNQWDRWWRQNS